MQIDKLKNLFSEDEATKAIGLLQHLDSEKTIEAVVHLSEGSLKWLKKYIKLAKKNESDLIHAYITIKKEQEIQNDIWISKNEKIKWINFDAKNVIVKSIDKEIKPIQDFLKSLEINCDALCCGIRAFSYFKDNIEIKYKKQKDRESIRTNLNNLITYVGELDEEIVSSSVLNQLIHKSVLLQLLIHLKSSIPST